MRCISLYCSLCSISMVMLIVYLAFACVRIYDRAENRTWNNWLTYEFYRYREARAHAPHIHPWITSHVQSQSVFILDHQYESVNLAVPNAYALLPLTPPPAPGWKTNDLQQLSNFQIKCTLIISFQGPLSIYNLTKHPWGFHWIKCECRELQDIFSPKSFILLSNLGLLSPVPLWWHWATPPWLENKLGSFNPISTLIFTFVNNPAPKLCLLESYDSEESGSGKPAVQTVATSLKVEVLFLLE